MVEMAASIWRDYVTDGVPASGSKKPEKSKIRAWGAFLEGRQVGSSLLYTYSSSTADADPGAGIFRLNNATIASATALYIDGVDKSGATVSVIIDAWDDSTSTVRGILTIRGVGDAAVSRVFAVTGAVLDGTGYRKVTIAYLGGSGSFVNGDDFLITFDRTGDTSASYVSTRAALKALDPTKETVVYLTESGREGVFIWKTGNWSGWLPIDTREGVIIPANSVPTGNPGAWIRGGDARFPGGINSEWFYETTDGANDALSIQAAINMEPLLPDGFIINLQSRIYNLATEIVLVSDVGFRGTNTTAIWGNGTVLKNTQAGTNPMFRAGAATAGIRFENLKIDGNLKNAASVYGGYGVTPGVGGFGSYGMQFVNVQFYQCRPAFHGINSFDIWFERCMFNECGNGAAGVNPVNTTIYMDGSQNFHVESCFVDTSFGRFIYATNLISIGNFITNNHIETHSGAGFVFIDGVFDGTVIAGNSMWQQPGGNMVQLRTNAGNGNRNHIEGNDFFNPLGFAVDTAGNNDVIADNTTFKNASTDHFRTTGTATRFSNNAISGNTLSVDGITDSGTDTRFGGVKKGNFTATLTATGATFNATTSAVYEVDEAGWVTANVRIELGASGNTFTANPLTIVTAGGLPVPVSDITFDFSGWHSLAVSYVKLTGRMPATATISVNGLTAAGTSTITAINANALANSAILWFTARYRTAL